VGIDTGKIDSKKDINYKVLQQAGIVSKSKDGLKLLNKGALKAKVTIEVSGASKTAIAAVEKVGGKVIVTAKTEISKEEGKPIKAKKAKADTTVDANPGTAS
jgi:large subunit ribosomal protein L15